MPSAPQSDEGRSSAPESGATSAPGTEWGDDARGVEGRDTEQPLRVLLVEDAADSRLLLQAYLKQVPCQVEVAENGAVAIEAFARGTYDLVLMDMQMPALDGYAAVQSIRTWEAEHGRRPVPILALSAYASREDADRSLAAGCSAYLAKPVRKAALLEAIRDQMRATAECARRDLQEEETIVLGGNAEIAKLAPHFLANRQRDVEALQEALEYGDFTTIEDLGHRMRGSGGAYGFQGITEIGQALETAAKQRDAEAIRRGIRALSVYLQQVELEVARDVPR